MKIEFEKQFGKGTDPWYAKAERWANKQKFPISFLLKGLIAWMKERLGYTLERYVCSGVTTVVSLGGPVHIEMAGRATAMQMERAPRVLLAGGPISNSGLEWIFDGKPAVFAADTEDDMRALVRDFHEKGYDAIKLGFLAKAFKGQVEEILQKKLTREFEA